MFKNILLLSHSLSMVCSTMIYCARMLCATLMYNREGYTKGIRKEVKRELNHVIDEFNEKEAEMRKQFSDINEMFSDQNKEETDETEDSIL